MSRNLLHKTKLEPFKAWLELKGIQHRPARGDYQVLQVQIQAPAWFCVFDRDSSTERQHFTVDHRLEPTVRRFIAETRPQRTGDAHV